MNSQLLNTISEKLQQVSRQSIIDRKKEREEAENQML
jgi:hypothetical protein